MPEPATKKELVAAMIAAREELDALVERIPRAVMELPGTYEQWSVKDILTHITCYDRWLGLTMALRGQKPPDKYIEGTSLDELNERLYRENRDLPLDEALRQSLEVWKEVLEAARSRTEAYLFSEQSVEGVPFKFTPSTVLKNEAYGHYLEHLPDLQAWLDQSQPA